MSGEVNGDVSDERESVKNEIEDDITAEVKSLQEISSTDNILNKVEEGIIGEKDHGDRQSKEDAELLGRLRKQQQDTASNKHKKLQASMKSAFIDEDYSDDDEFDGDGNFLKPSLIRQGGGGANAEVIVDYKEPTTEMIKKFVQKKHVRDAKTGKKLSYCSTQVSKNILFKRNRGIDRNINKLGPGIASYFYFLKLYAYAFLCFGVLSIPSMFLNYKSSANQDIYMTLSTGNLAGDLQFEVMGKLQEVTIEAVGYVQIITDLIVILLFLLLIEYSVYFFKKEQYKYEVEHPNLEQFTIEVGNLPKGITHKDIAKFFEDFVANQILNVEDEEEDMEGGDYLEGDQIHDVQLVTTTKKQLSFAIKVADLARNAEHKEAKYVLAQKKVDSGKMSSARFSLILRDYTQAVNKLKTYWAEHEKFQTYDTVTPIKAFVTFHSIKICQQVIEAFNPKLRFNSLCTKREEKLYFQDQRLLVRQAVSPALFKWENVDFRKASRRRRGCAAFLIIILLLIISSATVFAASKVEKIDLFQVFDEEQNGFIEDLDNDCPSFFEDVGNEVNEGNILDESECADEILISDLDENCTKAFFCFCELNKFRNPDIVFSNAICKEILFDELIKLGFSILTGFLVAIFNFILEVFISNTVKFEKDHDRSKEEKKLFNRLFVATYINTALITLITELSFKDITGFAIFEDLGFFVDGDFIDFTSDWYREVGADIVLIAIFNIIGSHALGVYQYISFNLSKAFFKPISIEDIKTRYLGPGFLLPLRYAQASVIIYFTLTYSSGIPLLYPLGALALMVAYYVDKFLLLKLCRSPPLYNNDMVIWICKGLRIALLIHNLFAVIMLSEPNLLPFDDGFIDPADITNLNNATQNNALFERIFNGPVILLTLMLILTILYQILAQFETFLKFSFKFFKKIFIYFGYVLICLVKVFTCYFCWKRTKKEKQEENSLELLKGYQQLEALRAQRDEVKLDKDKLIGLSSYNILANPLYARKLKLKGNKSFSSLLAEENVELHSTEEVLPLLDKGQGRNEARFIFKRQESTRGGFMKRTKTLDSANRAPGKGKTKKLSTLARTLKRKKSSIVNSKEDKDN